MRETRGVRAQAAHLLSNCFRFYCEQCYVVFFFHFIQAKVQSELESEM